jgi:hypothetical protein
VTSPAAERLRALLARRGSYPAIAAASDAGALDRFPVALFPHVGDVYGRVEAAAADDPLPVVALRLAALVHEEPPASLPALLAGAGLADLAPTVRAVVGAFGALWRVACESELDDFLAAGGLHLPAILLFEVAHEGRAVPAMQRAAARAGLGEPFARWAARLAASAPAASATPSADDPGRRR